MADLNLTFNASSTFTSIYQNWTTPALDQLDFSKDCALVGQWARTWLSSERGVNERIAARYFRHALPPEVQLNVTDGQLIDWYHILLDLSIEYNGTDPNPFILYVTQGPFEACLSEVCETVESGGIPDITGPGAMITAWMQAIFSTALAIFPMWEWHIRRKGAAPGPKQQLFFDAFNGTLGVFVSSALMMSMCISIATIILMATYGFIGDGAQFTLARDMTVFSIMVYFCPAYIDELIHNEVTRQAATRNTMLVISLLSYIVAANIAPLMSRSSRLENLTHWEFYCFYSSINKERRVTNMLIFVTSMIFWGWLVIFFLLPLVFGKIFPRVANGLRRGRNIIKVYMALHVFLLMWYMLISITVMRALLLERAGDDADELKWTFGQVLSLSTWLPVGFELYYLFRKGIAAGLRERLPAGWDVVKVDQVLTGDTTSEVSTRPMVDTTTDEENRPSSGHSSSSILLQHLETAPVQVPRGHTF